MTRTKKPPKTAEELAWDFYDVRGSYLEWEFITQWLRLAPDGIVPLREYRFARPEKEYRFDFAFIDAKVAVEMQGGVWRGGRHNRGKGMRDDYDKHILATLMGWRVIYLTADMLSDDPDRYIKSILTLVLRLKGERREHAVA